MQKGRLLYEGKAKKLFETEQENVLMVEYLDQATALNGLKKDEIVGKGQLNNQITSLIFKELSAKGIETHFIKKISKDEQLVEKVKMLLLEVVVRNVAAGSFTKRLGISEGSQLAFPIVEFYFKEDRLDDPFINEQQILVLSLATEAEILQMKKIALQVNKALQELFLAVDICLVDFKIEFGDRKSTRLNSS